jgi:hypothetical protein
LIDMQQVVSLMTLLIMEFFCKLFVVSELIILVL